MPIANYFMLFWRLVENSFFLLSFIILIMRNSQDPKTPSFSKTFFASKKLS